MSEVPSYSFFSNIDYDYLKLGESVGGSPPDMEYELSLDRDVLPVCKDNYEEYPNLFLSNSFNLSDTSSFADFKFNFEDHNLPFDENSLPSNFVKHLSNCEYYLDSETDFESLSKELLPHNTLLESEQFDKEVLKVFEDFPENHNFKDKNECTSKYPITSAYKKDPVRDFESLSKDLLPINTPLESSEQYNKAILEIFEDIPEGHNFKDKNECTLKYPINSVLQKDRETDFEPLSKELLLNTPLDTSEQFNKEISEQVHKDFPEGPYFKDKNTSTTKFPYTVVLKKFTSTSNNSNMVAPINIPKTTYTMVRVPGENATTNIPEKVSVVKLYTTPSKKNKTFSTLKSPEDIKKEKLSPIFLNKNITKECLRKVPKKLSHINNSISEVVNYDELPFTSLKRKSSNISKPKPLKKKAYELSPLPDPTLERCRRNAINAKKNREIKKQKMMKLESEVEKERREKLKLASENEALKQKNEELNERIQFLINAMENSSEPTPQNIQNWQRFQGTLDESNASSTRKTFTHN